MPTLIDKLITRVDSVRSRVHAKIGDRRFTVARVIRTYASGEIGDGGFTDAELAITPDPEVDFAERRDTLERGRTERGTCTIREISLTYTYAQLRPTLVAGQQAFYKITDSKGHGQPVSYWVLSREPEADRCETMDGNLQWVLTLVRAEI